MARMITDADVRRFWSKVDKTGECWLWTAGQAGDQAKSGNGYGAWAIRGTTYGAHRFSWILANGPIPSGMEIDHTCFVRRCVNPAHLRLLDRARNAQNLSGPPSGSRSGVRGVSYFRPVGRWRVRVRAFGRDHFGGYFDTLSEAEERAIQMRRELHPTNIG